MKKALWILIVTLLLCLLFLTACDDAIDPPPPGGTEQMPPAGGNEQPSEGGDEADSPEAPQEPEETKPCEHEYGYWVTVKWASCAEEGSRSRACRKCSSSIKESIPKTDTHTVVVDAAVAATCKSTGLTEGSHCSVCQETFVKQMPVPIKDHQAVTDAAVPATCKSTGLTEGSHCSACGTVLVAQKTVPVQSNHTGGAEKNGQITCIGCGKVLQDNIRHTVTFKMGSTVLKTQSLQAGEAIVAPTIASNRWYVWNAAVPQTMPTHDLEFTAIAVGGSAYGGLTWKYDLRGTLHIAGNGYMSNYSENSQPWAEYKSEITSITFDSTIYSIGKFAFFGCTALKTVVIPNTVKTVGEYAFANCTEITSITVGSGVKSIGTGAFASCSSTLSEVRMNGALSWEAKLGNYRTTVTFAANKPGQNASLFLPYCSGSFTAQ